MASHTLLRSISFLFFVLTLTGACGAIPNEDIVAASTSDDDSAATEEEPADDTPTEEEGGGETEDEEEAENASDTEEEDDAADDEPVVVEDPHDRYLRGEALFTDNCALCHGSFESRPVEHIIYYTPARIEYGIANFEEMAELDFLTDEEIETIIYSLQVHTETIAEGDEIVIYDTPVVL